MSPVRALAVAIILESGCSLSTEGLGSAAPGEVEGGLYKGSDGGGTQVEPPTDDSGVSTEVPGIGPGDEAAAGSDSGEPLDAGSTDTGTNAQPDTGLPPPPPLGPCNGPCLVPPNGWTAVAFIATAASSTTCPAGFGSTPTDFVEGATANASACTCGTCNVMEPPTCQGGSIPVHYDNTGTSTAGTCSILATPNTEPLTVTDGGCGTDNYNGSYAGYDIKYNSPPASGGTCTAAGAATGKGVNYGAQSQGCVAPAGSCGDGGCSVPSPFKACIMMNGDESCPAPMTDKHLVGTQARVSCSDCLTCTVTGTCVGTVTLYQDGTCKRSPYSVVADGRCDPIYMQKASYNSYTYDGGAPTRIACQASNSSVQAVSLVSEATICCAP